MAVYLFIGIIILMMLLVVVLIGPRLFSAPDFGSGIDRYDANIAIYRDEMECLNALLRAGDFTETEYAEAKTDLNRRLMAEVTSPSGQRFYATELSPSMRGIGYLVLGVIPIIALGIYAHLGNLQTLQLIVDVPNSITVDQSMMPAMSTYLERHPEDARAWILLARSEMNLNRFKEAAEALERAMDASEKVRQDPAILCELAEALGMAQGGVLRGRPYELVRQALAIQPDYPVALEMAGSAAYEIENYQQTLFYWKTLLSKMDPNTDTYRKLKIAISYVQAKSGIYDLDIPPPTEPARP